MFLSKGSQHSPLSLLVVDNDPAELGVLARKLGEAFDIQVASTPAEALDWLEREPFDVLLADHALPEMSGAELLARARLIQPTMHRVIMSAPSDAGELLTRIDCGDVHRFLGKPVTADRLSHCTDTIRRDTLPGIRRCVVVDAQSERGARIAQSLGEVRELAVPQTELATVPGAACVLLVEPASSDEVARAVLALGGPARRTAVVVVLEMGTDRDAAPFLLAGADDVMWLPLRPQEVLLRYRAWRSQRATREEAERVRAEMLSEQPFAEFVGRSDAMQHVFQALHRVATTDATVMLSGETGTGKELLARAIHALSPRRNAPFVAVNLSALPETLLESELFGHERGAFTGAAVRRLGRLETIDGGTLFLDEIGDLSAAVQVKLLRVLQERTFERVGSHRSRETDFRLVCATHRNLEQMVAQGAFREDLYYRINVIRIDVPPLRERRGDVALLADWFLRRFAPRAKKQLSLSDAALTAMARHSWPGNVRELEHMIERGVAMAENGAEIGTEILGVRAPRGTLQDEARSSVEDGRGIKEVLAEVERTILVETLQLYDGNQLATARKLKMPRATLQHRLRKLGL